MRLSSALLSLILLAGLTPAGRLRAQPAAPARPDAGIATAPVEFDGAILFRVRGASSLPAEARAHRIQERLLAIAGDPAVAVDSIMVVDDDGTSRIMAGDQMLMTVVDADASLEQVGRRGLADAHASRIRHVLAGYRAARSATALRRDAARAAAATLMLIVSIAGLFWFRRWLEAFITRRWRARIHSIGIQSLELLPGERIWSAVRSLVLTLRAVIVLVIVLAYVGFVLAQFPWTRGLSKDVLALALAPVRVIASGIVASIPRLAFLAVLFVVVRLVLRLIHTFFDAVGRETVKLERFEPDWAEPTYNIIRILVIAFGLVVAYPYIPGAESPAFKGVSLFIGVLFSLGSSAALSNIIAGHTMRYRRAFKVGDRIEIAGTLGDVQEVGLQVTHLRSLKNEELIVPNSQILAGTVRNYSSLARTGGLILHTDVGIGYETPWRQVEAMLIMAADRTPDLLREPRAFVLEKKLDDFSVIYELNVYCGDVQSMLQSYAALHRNILDVFNEYGVQIMTPAYRADPAEPKVVPPTLLYAAPAKLNPPDAA